jgi:integrase
VYNKNVVDKILENAVYRYLGVKMAKRVVFEEGQIYSIELSKNKWTLGQLCNFFTLENSTYKQWTLALFDYIFETETELINNADIIKLNMPVMIITSNGNPVKFYGYKLVGKREINYENIPEYKKNISKTLGLYNDRSSDPYHILKAFFGLFPYDGYYKDDYIDEYLIKGTKKRKDVKYLKDFTIEELKKILPANSIKLKRILEDGKI